MKKASLYSRTPIVAMGDCLSLVQRPHLAAAE
jgi:hypothetical protein